MAFIQCSFYSKVLERTTALNVILPEPECVGRIARVDSDGKMPVLYLLHGYFDDYSSWIRKSAIERYAQDKQIAVVMPDAGKSFYTDMAYGDNYFEFIANEVREIATSWFPLSTQSAHNYIAGISMGGYGAMKIAFTYPERYRAVVSLSGVVDIVAHLGKQFSSHRSSALEAANLTSVPRFDLIFGDCDMVARSKDDLFYLIEKQKEKGVELPAIYISCGTDDFLYEDNLKLKSHLDWLGIRYDYEDEKVGHEWWYWDQQIQKFIEML